ncbi:ribonucleotide-diphosphate reductase subunit beta [Enterococcus faecalis]|uniref:ribonucleotide-diphosphate reductase subunit beta n=1 Tax=Enterococcus faecalis TaxID=1351 RepID=UPI003CC656AE
MGFLYYKAINWNEQLDYLDQYTWEKLTNNFWLDTRISVKEDRNVWNVLELNKKEEICNLLACASLSTAIQSEIGVASLRQNVLTQQEEAILNVITFMESVHTKSFTTIFRSLDINDRASEYYQFADTNPTLQKKVNLFEHIFKNGNNFQKKAAFIFLESALTFGCYAPILKEKELVQSNKIIRNILQGSGLFIAYSGYKFQQAFMSLTQDSRNEFINWFKNFSAETILEEICFYDSLSENTRSYANNLLSYGANYAFNSMGFEKQFEEQLTPSTKVYLDNILMTTNKLFKQSLKCNNIYTEKTSNDDYTF